MDTPPTVDFTIVDDLYERYIIVIADKTQDTSVYCQECGEWAARFSGAEINSFTVSELYEEIIASHESQVRGEHVLFDDSLSL